MAIRINRREFIKASSLVSGGVGAALSINGNSIAAETAASPPLGPLAAKKDSLPMGKIGGVELSRLMLGGNVVSGYPHARDLSYVSTLMKRYNSESKILETLELAEIHGINAINLAIWDNISYLQKHWKRGGKMKLVAQALPSLEGDLTQFKKAVDFGACAVHIQGHGSERLVKEQEFDLLARIMETIQSQKVPAGIAAHALSVIAAVEKAKINVDFYVKTLHTRDYFTAQPLTEKGDFGRYDNSWCPNADEVIETMESIKKPWIAFKVMAAGAISPGRAFPHAFNGGADFILAGMFDWQIPENIKITKEALAEANRTRPWRS